MDGNVAVNKAPDPERDWKYGNARGKYEFAKKKSDEMTEKMDNIVNEAKALKVFSESKY